MLLACKAPESSAVMFASILGPGNQCSWWLQYAKAGAADFVGHSAWGFDSNKVQRDASMQCEELTRLVPNRHGPLAVGQGLPCMIVQGNACIQSSLGLALQKHVCLPWVVPTARHAQHLSTSCVGRSSGLVASSHCHLPMGGNMSPFAVVHA